MSELGVPSRILTRRVLCSGAALLLLIGVLLERGMVGSAGVGFLDSGKTVIVFAVLSVVPGYLVMCAFGATGGEWVDWLAPSFCTSIVLSCVFVPIAYALTLPLWSTIAFLGGVSVIAFGVCAYRRAHSRLGTNEGPNVSASGCSSASWMLGLASLLLMALTAHQSLRAVSAGSDYWLHMAKINSLVRSGTATLADPYHADGGVHPVYFMNVWYLLVGSAGWVARVATVDSMRALPIALVPVAVSAFACLARVFTRASGARAMAVAFFVAFHTLFSEAMEGSPDPSMWSQFAIPRWVALFCVYPVVLSLGVSWVLDGDWRRLAAASLLNGAAMFIHPQGGLYYLEVLAFLLAGSVLFRSWSWSRRGLSAIIACVLLIAPFVILRWAFLPKVLGAGGVSMLTSRSASGVSAIAAVGDRFQGQGLGRASSLLLSPLYLTGLLLCPLWWRDAREAFRARALLFCLGPALCLPFLPLLDLLPFRIYSNLVYRGVWAAPVLVASGVGIWALAAGKQDSREGSDSPLWIGWAGSLYVASLALLAVLLHLWPPRSFEALFSLKALWPASFAVTGAFAVGAWVRTERRLLRGLAAAPVACVVCLSMTCAVLPQRAREEARFGAERASSALKTLAEAKDKSGYVLAGTVLSGHLTALTGRHVLGGNKSVIYVFNPEHRRMHEDLLRMLKCDQDLAGFVWLLRSRDVRKVCVFAEANRSIVERLGALPHLFPVLEDDAGIRLHDVDLRPKTLRSEASRLSSEAGKTAPDVALRLLEAAADLSVDGTPSAKRLAAARERAASEMRAHLARLKLGGPDLGRALLSASRFYRTGGLLAVAKKQAASSALSVRQLRAVALDLSMCRMLAYPLPHDRRRERNGLKQPFRMSWTHSNEVGLEVVLPEERLIKSIELLVRASEQRLPASVGAILKLGGDRRQRFELRLVTPRKPGQKMWHYRVDNVLLTADRVDVRCFTERAHSMNFRGLEIKVLEAGR